jgi:hypothetical protein
MNLESKRFRLGSALLLKVSFEVPVRCVMESVVHRRVFD